MTTNFDSGALEAISALQCPGKPDLLARVVYLFKSESPKAITVIMEGLDADDLQAVRSAAHSLKSSSTYLGATELAARCRDLEEAAGEKNTIACIMLGEGLDELFHEFCTVLDLYMAKVA